MILNLYRIRLGPKPQFLFVSLQIKASLVDTFITMIS